MSCPRFADIDNDNDLDLFVYHDLSEDDFDPPRYYPNDGSGFFTDATIIGDWDGDFECCLKDYGVQLRRFGISDIDLDGDLDFICGFIVKYGTMDIISLVKLFGQDDDGGFICKSSVRFVSRAAGINSELSYGFPMFAELDNAAGEDIIWEKYLIRNSEGGFFKNFEDLEDLGFDHVSAPCVLDYDRDGDNDVIIGNYCGCGYGEVFVLQNQVDNLNWLQVDPVGIISNRDAIGAKVYVYSEFHRLSNRQRHVSGACASA